MYVVMQKLCGVDDKLSGLALDGLLPPVGKTKVYIY